MNSVPELLNNPWVTGIGGGLVSGLLVFWITQRIFSNRNIAEYRQKVDATNRDVIYAIRPGIPEEVIPDKDVVEALIHATARKHGVTAKDAFDCSLIAEELIKEVMDSSFISAKQKADFCSKLRSLMLQPSRAVQDPNLAAGSAAVATADRVEERRFYATAMAAMLAMVAAAMTILLLSWPSFGRTSSATIERIPALLIPAVIVLSAALVPMALFDIRRSLRRASDRRQETEPQDTSSR